MALTGHVVALAWSTLRNARGQSWLVQPATLLIALLFAQLALGLATLIDLYVRAAFSPHRISGGEALQALRLWRRMRMRLWRYWLQHKITARKQRGSNEHTV